VARSNVSRLKTPRKCTLVILNKRSPMEVDHSEFVIGNFHFSFDDREVSCSFRATDFITLGARTSPHTGRSTLNSAEAISRKVVRALRSLRTGRPRSQLRLTLTYRSFQTKKTMK